MSNKLNVRLDASRENLSREELDNFWIIQGEI